MINVLLICSDSMTSPHETTDANYVNQFTFGTWTSIWL